MRKGIAIAVCAACASGLVAACSDGLGRGRAAQIVEDHLRLIAPRICSADSCSVLVEEVREPSEREREIRFRVVRRDTSAILGAAAQRSDTGWSLSSYNAALIDYLRFLIVSDGFQAYERLLAALPALQDALLTDSPLGGMDTLSTLKGLRWGLSAADLLTGERFFWVRPGESADSAVVCAERALLFGRSDIPTLDWSWVEGSGAYCKGRTRKVFTFDLLDAGMLDREAAREGGVLTGPW